MLNIEASSTRSTKMTTTKFEATPSPSEGIDLKEISIENVKDAWQEYQAKPEYKKFNKHDMIEAMQSPMPEPSKS